MFRRKNEIKYEMKSPFSKVVIGCITVKLIAILITFLVMMLLAGILDTIWVQLISTFVGIFFYTSMLYSACWNIAERDRNLVKFGHMEEDKMRGLKAGIYSTIPLFIFTVIAIFESYTGVFPDFVLPVYRIITCPFIAIVVPCLDNGLAFILVLLCGVTPLCTWLGYKNGYVLYRVMDKVVYTKPRSKDKRIR